MARDVDAPAQRSLGVIEIEIERNACGRKLDSFEARGAHYPVAFIRAPVIRSLGASVRVKEIACDRLVWVESERAMVTTFRPGLSGRSPSPVHVRFLEMVMR